MSERQEKKKRYNLRLMWIADFDMWLNREPPMWRVFAWQRWKRERPEWMAEEGERMNCSDCKNVGMQICTVCCTYQGGVPDRWEPKTLTNADRIRGMSDEELAGWIATVPLSHDDICPSPLPERCSGSNGYDAEACKQCWLGWLRQEADDAL